MELELLGMGTDTWLTILCIVASAASTVAVLRGKIVHLEREVERLADRVKSLEQIHFRCPALGLEERVSRIERVANGG